MTRALLLLIGSGLLLAACTRAGPDYHGPQSQLLTASAANGAFASRNKGPFTDQPVLGQWWVLYNDAVLNGLIGEAIAANADLRIAAARIDSARARLAQADANRSVQTAVGGGVTLARPSGSRADLPGSLGYDAGFGISYDIDVAGRIARLAEAASADVEAAQGAHDLVRIIVAARVADAYVQACAASHQRTAALHSIAVQQQSLASTERLFQAGRVSTLDRTRARAQLAQLQAVIPDFDAARDAALFSLATLLGRPPADLPVAASDCTSPPRLDSPIPTGDGASLIRRRPDIRAAERQVAAASARIGVSMADLYPRITLGASTGLAGPVGDIGSTRSFGFSLGPLISWQFPNRKAVRANIAEAEADERGARATFDATLLNALRETETALDRYGRELERHAALSAAREAATTAADQTRRLYRAGRENYLAVLDAERTEAVARAALAASDGVLARDRVALFLALGGGWTVPQP